MERNTVEVKDLSKKFTMWTGKDSTLKSTIFNLIRGQRLRKEEFWGLKDISFSVKKGETFGIIGSNGSGKTSLLRILAGIIVPTSGKLTINGKISTLFELGTGFHPDLTGKENIYLNGSILGLSRKLIEEKFDEIVRFSELGKFIDTPLKHYSSGMQVRLAFSIAISFNPEVLLVDEVLAVGDAEFQRKSYSVFQDFKRRGATIIIVSHDLDTIKAVCNRVLFLNKGKQMKVGGSQEVVNAYQKFVSKEEGLHSNFSKKESDRLGDGKAKVERIWVENVLGRKTNILDGERLIVKMRCTFYEDSNSPIFGLIMKDKEGKQILVTNTLRKSVSVGNFKRGEGVTVTFNFPNVFEVGYYSFTPGIAYSDAKRFYDWRTDCLEIFVKQLYQSGGIINPSHEINLS